MANVIPAVSSAMAVAENVFRVKFMSAPYFSTLLDAGDASNPAAYVIAPVAGTTGWDGNPARPVFPVSVVMAANGDPSSVDVIVDRPMSPYPAQYGITVLGASFPNPGTYPNIWQWSQSTRNVTYEPDPGLSGPNFGPLPSYFCHIWGDLSGSGNDWKQNTGSTYYLIQPRNDAEQPQTTPGEYSGVPRRIGSLINGVLTLDFFGTDDFPADKWLQTVATPTAAFFANHSLFAVVQADPLGNQANKRIIENAFNACFDLGTNGAGTNFKYYVNSTGLDPGSPGAITAGTPQILCATFDSTIPGGGTGTMTLYINGVQVATTTATTPSSASTYSVFLNTYFGAPGTFCFQGNILETSIFTDCKKGTDLLNLNRYFGLNWNVVVP